MAEQKTERTVRTPERFLRNKMIKIVGPDAYAVFSIIVLHAKWSGDWAGNSWPTYQTIQLLTGIRKEIISKSIRKLEGCGYIKVEKRKRRRKDGTEYGRIRNHYTVSHMLAQRGNDKNNGSGGGL